jgi:hypothetical protein
LVNALPVALIDATPDVQTIGDSITFSAERSNDMDGSLVSFQWDFGDGNSSSQRVVDHTYTDVGSYTVTLTVSDNRGAQATDTMFVRVVFRTFDVNFTSRSANLDNVREYTTEGAVSQMNSTIDVANLHVVKFRLTWRDNMKPPGGDPNDVFRFTVTPPDGFAMSANGSSEDLMLIFPLASIPLNRTMEGRDADTVRAEVEEQMGSSLGKGTWLIHIEAVECGGFWENNEYNADPGNYWDMAVHYEYFDISVTTTQ